MIAENKKQNSIQIQNDEEPTRFMEFAVKTDNKMSKDDYKATFAAVCESIKSDDNSQVLISIYALKRILQIVLAFQKTDQEICQEIYGFVLQADFLLFLLQKMQSNFVHPFFLKNALKIFTFIMIYSPQVIDNLLQINFFQTLISLQPNKYATKCILKMIELNENFRSTLIQSHFYKSIFQMIESLGQMYSSRRYGYEKLYAAILLALQQFIQFDDSDYKIFLKFFIRNFKPHCDIENEAQKQYIDFLLKSEDPQLMLQFFYHPCGIVNYLLDNFNRPAYSHVRDEVLLYFEKLITSSGQFASFFATPIIANKIISNMLIDSIYVPSASHFICTICLSSLENCQNLMTEELFSNLFFYFTNDSFSIQLSVFMIFLALLRYPPSSTFFQYFSNTQLFNPDLFFEFGDVLIQNEYDEKMSVLAIFNILLDHITVSHDKLILDRAYQHMISDDFISILHDCMNSEDSDFAQASKIVFQKIDDLISV